MHHDQPKGFICWLPQPDQVSMTTCEGDIAKLQYLGTLRLALTDDSNKYHSYGIPDCIYDPDYPVNIVGIPALSGFFDDAANGPDATAEDDGTTILSSGKRSHSLGIMANTIATSHIPIAPCHLYPCFKALDTYQPSVCG